MIIENKNRELAIKLSDVRKMYKLGQIGGGTLQADIQSWWAKKRGLEDPNSKIGEERLVGKTFMALNGVTLDIYKGEALGIIGGNGAGKSTMLKLLSRVTAPTSGKIQIWGRIASMLEVGTGFNGEMTGRENVYMNGAILGMTKSEIDAKMDDIIEFSEVRDFIDTPVKRYSSGMYVKLAFSVAAHLDSEIMIMDEVLAVGDTAFQRKCLNKMRSIAKEENRTVLYVSHNMSTIRQLCDRCIVLDQGKVIYNGDVDSAISVYMKESTDNRTIFDYSNVKRMTHLSQNLRLDKLELLNTGNNQYYPGENVEFELTYSAKADIEDAGLRFEIAYADGSVIGTVFTKNRISAKAGQTYKKRMVLNTINFTPGIYHCVALTFLYDKYGHQAVMDRVAGALTLRINEKENPDVVWLPQHWGHVRFSPIENEN